MSAPLIPPSPELTHLAQIIQLAVAPVFLLAGLGAFLNVCAGRLARIIDRARQLVETDEPCRDEAPQGGRGVACADRRRQHPGQRGDTRDDDGRCSRDPHGLRSAQTNSMPLIL
jgi:hypothetical protein